MLVKPAACAGTQRRLPISAPRHSQHRHARRVPGGTALFCRPQPIRWNPHPRQARETKSRGMPSVGCGAEQSATWSRCPARAKRLRPRPASTRNSWASILRHSRA